MRPVWMLMRDYQFRNSCHRSMECHVLENNDRQRYSHVMQINVRALRYAYVPPVMTRTGLENELGAPLVPASVRSSPGVTG